MLIYEKAPAKVNLTLSVLDKRADGYHNLTSLVAFADLADDLEIELNQKAEVIVEGAFAKETPKGAANSVFKAMAFLGIAARVKITKNIPLGAGLGGGSADCAAFLRACARVKIAVPNNLFTLGADVPACYLAQSLWLSGAGERVESVMLPKLYCVLASAANPSATEKVFSAWDKAPHNKREGKSAKEKKGEKEKAAPIPYRDFANADDVFTFCQTYGNDLTPFVPQAEGVLAALAELTPRAYGMSGSGSACFALYQGAEAAQAAAARLEQKTDFLLWEGELG